MSVWLNSARLECRDQTEKNVTLGLASAWRLLGVGLALAWGVGFASASFVIIITILIGDRSLAGGPPRRSGTCASPPRRAPVVSSARCSANRAGPRRALGRVDARSRRGHVPLTVSLGLHGPQVL